MVGFKFTGSAELARGLSALPQELRREVLIDALKAAAEPMRGRMGSLATRSDEAPHIADSIVISVVDTIGSMSGRWATTANEATVAVGPSKGFLYGLLLEYGPKAPRPFMRPAFDETSQESITILARKLWSAIAPATSSRAIATPTGGSGGSL